MSRKQALKSPDSTGNAASGSVLFGQNMRKYTRTVNFYIVERSF